MLSLLGVVVGYLLIAMTLYASVRVLVTDERLCRWTSDKDISDAVVGLLLFCLTWFVSIPVVIFMEAGGYFMRATDYLSADARKARREKKTKSNQEAQKLLDDARLLNEAEDRKYR